MHDTDILRTIETLVGCAVPHVIEDGRCVELSLASDDALFHGLIRHLSADAKQEVLRAVSRLSSLRCLNLRRNLLGRLPAEFGGLRQLEHLNLGSNYLGSVPPEIRGFHSLRYLHLGNNDLSSLPEWLGEFEGLEYLTLHKNLKLKSIDQVGGLRHLKSLNLYFLNLLTLPDAVYACRKLTTLTLWNVHRFPHGLAPFDALEFLSNCGGPSTRALPPDLTTLKRLRMIRIFQNNLDTLPEDLGELEHLEQVSVYQNQLSRLPDSMAGLKKLTKLNLGWNRFESLPAWLEGLERLEWLAVFENPLRDRSALRLGAHVSRRSRLRGSLSCRLTLDHQPSRLLT
jgi:Leucine-rich repeat (LRR) protein